MSVLVTTTFSQGAVFYAGETLSCTISFTNPIISSANKLVTSSNSTPIPFSNASQQQTRPAPQPRTISSLASSTLAFLTRTAPATTTITTTANATATRKDPPHPLLFDHDEEKGIPVELDSPTPRSSIDTFLHPSPRSSMDSTASFRSSFQPNARRYSSSPLKKTVSEHLLCGFAQVVGSFVADPSLINLSEFGPLKHHTMYNPQGGLGGGGGLMVAKSDSMLDTRTLPVFSTPPSILFVDLDLAPGETKKYI
ncbi:hypothetical protein BD408DRAFT_111870 [Parasitella parasitica]|nr:hypothetical protein BD408DRAFT_111870 [Parasitella parasitica]